VSSKEQMVKKTLQFLATLLFLTIVNPVTISFAIIYINKPEWFSSSKSYVGNTVYECKEKKIDK
jgi:hypothetical protein